MKSQNNRIRRSGPDEPQDSLSPDRRMSNLSFKMSHDRLRNTFQQSAPQLTYSFLHQQMSYNTRLLGSKIHTNPPHPTFFPCFTNHFCISPYITPWPQAHLPHLSVKLPVFLLPITSLFHPYFPPSILLPQLSWPHTLLPPENTTAWHVLHRGFSTLLRGHLCSCATSWLPAPGHNTGARRETFCPACWPALAAWTPSEGGHLR